MEFAKILVREKKELVDQLIGKVLLSQSLAVEGKATDAFVAMKSRGNITLALKDHGEDPTLMFSDSEQRLASFIYDNTISLGLFFIESKDKTIKGYLVEWEMGIAKSGEGTWTLTEGKRDPVFNGPLIKAFKDRYEIDLANRKPFFNLLNYKEDALSQIKGKDIEFIDSVMISKPLVHEYIKRSGTNPLTCEPLLRLDSAKSSIPSFFSISDEDIYPFAKAFDYLNNQRVVAVVKDDPVLSKAFSQQLLMRLMRNGSKVLIAAKDRKDAERKREQISRSPLGIFLCPTSIGSRDFNIPAAADWSISRSLNRGDNKATKERESYLKQRVSYLQAAKELNGLGVLKTGEDILTGINKFSYYHSLRKTSFPLNVSSYNPDDFEKDKETLKYLNENDYVKKGSLKEKPLHSLKAIGPARQIYLALTKALAKTRKDLGLLQKAIGVAKGSEWGFGPIDFIGKYEQVRKDVLALLSYNGFPLDYFALAQDPTVMPLALRLEDEKGKIDQLFEYLSEYVKNVDLLSKPLKQYMEKYRSHSIFTKWQGKKKIRKLLRDKRDFDDFLTTLSDYISLTDSYDKDLSQGEKKFGLLVYSEEGPKLITSALEYIQQYEMIISEKPFLDRDNNAFVKMVLSNHDFRLAERDAIRSIDLSLDNVKDDFHGLKDMMADSFREYEETFQSLDSALSFRERATFADFVLYQDFLSHIANASSTMREALALYDEAGLPMEGFANDYWYSLYKSFAKERFGSDANDIYPVLSRLCDYLPDYLKDNSLMICKEQEEKLRKLWWDSPEGDNVRNSYLYAPYALPSDYLGNYWNLASAFCPLQVLSPDELPMTLRVSFDCVIVDDPSKFETTDLLILLSKGKEAVAMEGKGELDERFSSYPKVVLSERNLFTEPLQYDLMTPEFLNLLAFGFEENGFELETGKESNTDMPYSYVGKDGIRRGVIPSSLIGERFVQNVAFGLNKALLLLGKQPVVMIQAMPLVTDPKGVVEKADRQAEDFAKSQKKSTI